MQLYITYNLLNFILKFIKIYLKIIKTICILFKIE